MSDDLEAQRQAAWVEYFAEHPEVLASWHHQNGYWPYSWNEDEVQEA